MLLRNSMILVTGSSGLSGSYVMRELQGRGYAVRALVRATSAAKMSLPGVEIAILRLGRSRQPASRCAMAVDGIVHAACTFIDKPDRHRGHAGPARRLA